MMKKIKPTDSDYPYKLEQNTRNTRWLVIGVILATLPYSQVNIPLVLGLTALSVAFNLSRYSKATLDSSLTSSPLFIAVTDIVFIGMVLALTGGINSPYVLVLLFPLILATYLGRSKRNLEAALALLLSLMVLVVVAAANIQGVYFSEFRTVVVVGLLNFVYAYYVNQLTLSMRSQRHEALRMRRKAEEERRQLVTLIDSMTEGVMSVGSDHHIVRYNSVMQELLDITELEGVHINKLPELSLGPDKKTSFTDLLSSRTTFHSRDLQLEREDGSRIKLEINAAPLKNTFNEWGNNGAYIIVMEDITAEKDLEDQRQEFVSVISHELRTPVASVEASVSMLLNEKVVSLDEKARELAKVAYNQVVFLAEMVNDLSVLSRLENDSFAIEPQAFEVKDFLDQMYAEYAPKVKEKGLQLKVESSEHLPVIVTSATEVREILQNFIGNAIKYTEKGTITITAQPADGPDGGITLSVADSGIGIAESDLKHVFEKFYRSEDYRTRKTGGNGLGLYLCQMLAERLGGKIWAKSQLNKGTEFFLQLPPYSKIKQDSRKVMDAQINSVLTGI